MKYYDLDPLPIVSGDPAELFFDDREDCEFARTPGGWQVTFYHTDRITGDMEPSYHTDCDTLEKVAAEIPHSFCAADAVA